MRKDMHEDKNWRNVAAVILENRQSVRKLLTDEEQRIRIQFFGVYIVLFIVSMFMTVMNIITGWRLLMYSTLVFAVMNLVNILLCLFSQKAEMISRPIFGVEMLLLFAFFCISGEPEGFSAIWIALLPGSGLLLFRLKNGAILSMAEFLLLIFLFWTKAGNSLLQYEYTASFLMRFPMLYFAFFMVGVLFEYIRDATQKELTETRQQFEYLYKHDILTGVSNRVGYNNDVDEIIRHGEEGRFALTICDIDDFKAVNDTYGHSSGDVVLKFVADTFKRNVGEKGKVSRWGGEEFSVLFTSAENARELCETIRREVGAHVFDFNGRKCKVAVSMGLVFFDTSKNRDISGIFMAADANLYEAKHCGKNRIVSSDI